jgi:disulfide oxidoreductase YuzD
MKPPISVTLFDDSSGEHCLGCGERFDLVIERLKERYGDEVVVEYLDLAEPAARLQHQEVVNRVKETGLMLPLVAINGVLRLCGGVEYRTIVEAIETQKEVGCG